MSNIYVDIVSAESEIFSGEAAAVFAPALLGEVGIMPGHAPMVTKLGPGTIRVKGIDADNSEYTFYVSGGILEAQPKIVTILSDTVQRAEDLDEAAVLKAKEGIEKMLHDREAKIDYAKALAEYAELAAQLRTVQRLRRR